MYDLQHCVQWWQNTRMHLNHRTENCVAITIYTHVSAFLFDWPMKMPTAHHTKIVIWWTPTTMHIKSTPTDRPTHTLMRAFTVPRLLALISYCNILAAIELRSLPTPDKISWSIIRVRASRLLKRTWAAWLYPWCEQ